MYIELSIKQITIVYSLKSIGIMTECILDLMTPINAVIA